MICHGIQARKKQERSERLVENGRLKMDWKSSNSVKENEAMNVLEKVIYSLRTTRFLMLRNSGL